FPPAVQIAQTPANGTANIASAYRTPGFGPNWAVFLLPFYEQGNLYNQVAANIQNYLPSNGADQGWRNIPGTKIAIFLCPSDAGAEQAFSLNGGNWARGNYAIAAGAGWLNWTVGGLSKDGGSGGSNPSNNVGGVAGINWGTTMVQIRDGTA